MAEHHPTPQELEALAQGSDVAAGVRGHVAECPECQKSVSQFRANNEFLVDLLAAVAPGNKPTQERPAESVPGYRLLEILSAGGQGVVYRAVQERTGRIVAVKMLTGGWFASEKQRRRFEREIDIAASLRHPNIATVFDAIELRTGVHAFAMEYIDGDPLDKWEPWEKEGTEGQRDRGTKGAAPDALRAPGAATASRVSGLPISTPSAGPARSVTGPASGKRLRAKLELFVKVCDAIHYAHQRGIIHRDLKPSNILADDAGEPHILDFGIAVIAGEASERSEPRVTQSGEFTGTVEFASPEQAGGNPSQIDFRTDVYSLGVILYAMLTGGLPYSMEGPTLHKLNAIQHAPPDRPTIRNPALRGDPETIILKALEKEKARRYQTADELCRDIRHYLAGEPIEARRDSVLYVLGKRAKRNRGKLAVGALVLAAAGTALGVYLHKQSQITELSRQNEIKLAAKEREKARALTQEERRSIKRFATIVRGVLIPAGRSASEAEKKSLSQSADRLANMLASSGVGLSPTAQAEIRLVLADIYAQSGWASQAEFQLTAAGELAKGIEGETGEDLLARIDELRQTLAKRPEPAPGAEPSALLHAAESLVAERDGDGAVAAARKALEAYVALGADHACEAAACREVLARGLLIQNHAEEAQREAKEAADAIQGRSCADGHLPVRIRTTLAEAALARGNAPEAWRLLVNALSAAQASPDAGSLFRGGANALAAISAEATQRQPADLSGDQPPGAKRLEESQLKLRALDDHAVALLRAWDAGDAAAAAQRMLAAATVVADLLSPVEAVPISGAAVGMHASLMAYDDPRQIEALWIHGRLERRAGDPGAAITAMREAREAAPASLPAQYRDGGSHAQELCLAYARTDRWAEVAGVCEEELKVRRASGGPAQLAEIESGYRYVSALTNIGKFAEAARALDEVVARADGSGLSKNDPLAPYRLACARARLARKQGNAKEAIEQAQAAAAACERAHISGIMSAVARCEEGLALATLRRFEDAEAILKESLNTLTSDANADWHRPIYHDLAAMYDAWGKPEVAADIREGLSLITKP